MINITVPIASSIKEDQVAKQILKSSAEESEESGNRNVIDFHKHSSQENIKLILLGMGMGKYSDNFNKNNINLTTFLQLDEKDLREIGITNEQDLETITNNLQNFEPRQKKLLTKYSSLHDLQIARNVKNELILLQNYCSYLDLQMRKQKLTDYRINWKESATKYLKAFAEAALLQAKFLNRIVYHDSGDDHLIGRILKLNNLTLPIHLKEKLIKNKSKGRQKEFCVVFFGVLSAAIILKYVF